MIEFRCACGFKTQVKDELAGKKVACPKCGFKRFVVGQTERERFEIERAAAEFESATAAVHERRERRAEAELPTVEKVSIWNRPLFGTTRHKRERDLSPDKRLGVPSNRRPLCMLSFVIPIVGAIAAVLLLVKPNEEDRETGKACLRWVLYGLVVDAVIYFGVLFKFTDFFHFI